MGTICAITGWPVEARARPTIASSRTLRAAALTLRARAFFTGSGFPAFGCSAVVCAPAVDMLLMIEPHRRSHRRAWATERQAEGVKRRRTKGAPERSALLPAAVF